MLTKDRIIEVVIEMIKQNVNVSTVSLSEIAKKANIGKSTVYEHFQNKEELIHCAYMQILNYYENELLAPLNKNTYKEAFIEQYRRILYSMNSAKNMVETILSQSKQIWYPNSKVFDEKLKNLKLKMANRFFDIFHLGVKEGYIPIDTEMKEKKGYIIQAIMTGLLFQYINGQTKLDESELMEFCFIEVTNRLKHN